jgi:hypothetical protein
MLSTKTLNRSSGNKAFREIKDPKTPPTTKYLEYYIDISHVSANLHHIFNILEKN